MRRFSKRSRPIADRKAAISTIARAKVNLALHIASRRPDGLHSLSSIVVFPEIGDRITVEPNSQLTLEVEGPMAADVPKGEENLVVRAARLLDPQGPARITLQKTLPVAAGLGGGSADAAAATHLLSQLWGCSLPSRDRLAKLGADIPACMFAKPAILAGLGEHVLPLWAFPPLSLVLVNPGIPLPTGEVFTALSTTDNPPLSPDPDLCSWKAVVQWLQWLRNDLEEPAMRIQPAIGEILTALSSCDGCQLARMTGSGATCFGIFPSKSCAAYAARRISERSPAWWARATWTSDEDRYSARLT